jgi:2-polyprenyl-3-methyl-5-hydroxy-6-metoxy-1,4-benzoquinol methylase
MIPSASDARKTKMSKVHTVAGTEVKVREFESWNERMFVHYGNDRLYYHPNRIIRMIQAQRIRTIVSFMEIADSDVVLDAGCGEGYIFSRLPRSVRRVGVDLSPTALEIASSRNPDIEWIRSNVQRMPFDANTFDKVCCSEVIEHVIDPQAVIEELHRVVKPTGRVVITVPNEQTINRVKDMVLNTRLGRRIFPDIPLRTEWHLTEYTPLLLRSQIQRHFVIQREKVLPIAGLGLGYSVLCTPR